MSDDIAERMGHFDNRPPRQEGFSYNWRCKEFDDASGPVQIKPLPGQQDLFQ